MIPPPDMEPLKFLPATPPVVPVGPLTSPAAGKDHALHCGRGVAPGDGTAPLRAHHATCERCTADAARHRAVFNGASKAISCHAAGIARTVVACYLYALQHHVLHLAAGAEVANQPYIVCPFLVDGQPRDGLIFTVEGAGVWLAFSAYRRPLSRLLPSSFTSLATFFSPSAVVTV